MYKHAILLHIEKTICNHYHDVLYKMYMKSFYSTIFYVTCVYDSSFLEFILKPFKIDKKILPYSVLQKYVLRKRYQISLTQFCLKQKNI